MRDIALRSEREDSMGFPTSDQIFNRDMLAGNRIVYPRTSRDTSVPHKEALSASRFAFKRREHLLMRLTSRDNDF
jgi:hypothetical protein